MFYLRKNYRPVLVSTTGLIEDELEAVVEWVSDKAFIWETKESSGTAPIWYKEVECATEGSCEDGDVVFVAALSGVEGNLRRLIAELVPPRRCFEGEEGTAMVEIVRFGPKLGTMFEHANKRWPSNIILEYKKKKYIEKNIFYHLCDEIIKYLKDKHTQKWREKEAFVTLTEVY